MPQDLKPGILYVSEEFHTAAHLCACGCGSKVRTPLGPVGWSVEETRKGPTLRPSVGNWQKPCRSHYVITRGEVVWAGQWTPEQVAAGRLAEDERRRVYYESRARAWGGWLRRLWRVISSLWSLRCQRTKGHEHFGAGNPMAQIFVSHSSQDRELVDVLARAFAATQVRAI